MDRPPEHPSSDAQSRVVMVLKYRWTIDRLLGAGSNANKVKDTCGPSYLTCDQASVDNAATGKTRATVSTVTFIAGGALLAGGL